MNKVKLVILYIILVITLAGCQKNKEDADDTDGTDNTEDLNFIYDTSKKMEGMEHLYASNEYGYYFDIYSDISKNKKRDRSIEMKSSTDQLYFMIESAGKNREIAIQIFIDYEQIPIIVDGKEYLTYYVNADPNFSREYSFQFGKEIDETVNHKMLAAMTVSSNINAKDLEGRASYSYSLAYDEMLVFDKEQSVIADTSDYVKPEKEYQDLWQGLLINDDVEEFKRTIPEKELRCKPGEELELQYHIGGYKDCEEVLMVLAVDMKQIQINGQDYLKFKETEKNILNGTIKIKAPEKPGLYEFTGWVVKNPFSQEKPEVIPSDAAPRFTINVCE